MEPQRVDTLNYDNDYSQILALQERDAQDWSFNEEFGLQALGLQELGDAIFKDGAILSGGVPLLLGNGSVFLGAAKAWIRGRVVQVREQTLQYVPTKTSGIDTIYIKWLHDRVTANEDPLLVSPSLGEPVEERLRRRAEFVSSSTELFNEQFEDWSGTVPNNWTLVSGECDRGFPAKFGKQGLRLIHTSGTATTITASVALSPGVVHYVYFWARTKDQEQPKITALHGATIGITRNSPAYSPTPLPLVCNYDYERSTLQVLADGNTAPCVLTINIPASLSIPSTEILIDGVLITTEPLTALQLDRLIIPAYYWDRETNAVTSAISRIGQVQVRQWVPPLPGVDISNIEENEGLQRFVASQIFDIHGHFRLPGAMRLTRQSALDTSSKLGFQVGGGTGYPAGYPVRNLKSQDLLVDRALDAATISTEDILYSYGTQRYPLAKAVGLENFSIKKINSLTAIIESDGEVIGSHTAGGQDTMLETGNTQLMQVTSGTQASHTGSLDLSANPIIFTEANNTLNIRLFQYDGSDLGSDIVWKFARGTFTIDQILEALQRGSGPAFRSITIPTNQQWNIWFEKVGNALKIRTKGASTSSKFTIQASSTCLSGTPGAGLGLTSGTYTGTSTGSGIYTSPSSWKITGNSIDWTNYSAGNGDGAEPPGAYFYVARRRITLNEGVDYNLAGRFATQQLLYYRVTAWGPNGEGLVSNTVSRVTPVGSINLLKWAAVSGAISYHIYRSTNGTNFYYIGNVKDAPGTTLQFVDDGSFPANTSVIPSGPSTTLNGAVSTGGGTISITVASTTGFANTAGAKMFINGTDDVTYQSTDATHFLSCTQADIGQNWASGTTVTAGPTMNPVTIEEDELGVLNLSLASGSYEPMHLLGSAGMTISYDYYLPHVEVIVLNRQGVARAIKGLPSDKPPIPSLPSGDLMEIGQIRVEFDTSRILVVNNPFLDRPDVVELSRMRYRVDQLYEQAIREALISEMGGRGDITILNRGIYVDSMISHAKHDLFYNKGGDAWAAFVDTVNGIATVPHTLSQYKPTINSGTSTTATKNGKAYLPSSQVELIAQTQWSELFPVNPFSQYVYPDARIDLDPAELTWSIRGSSDVSVSVLLETLRRQLYAIAESRPSGNLRPGVRMRGKIRILIDGEEESVITVPPATPVNQENVERAVAQVRSIVDAAYGQVTPPADIITLESITITVQGDYFTPNETNIAARFGGQWLDFTAISPTTQGTTLNGKTTVNANGVGSFRAKITIPTSIPSGLYDVEAVGPFRTGRRTFRGTVTKWEPHVNVVIDNGVRRCPVAQAFSFPITRTVSGIWVYLDYKDRGQGGTAPTEPIEFQLQRMIAGVPSGEVVARKVINPSDITWGAKLDVMFEDYYLQPAGESWALVLLTPSNKYLIQVAKLGAIGKNPATIITSQPYPPGSMFGSADNETWTAFQEFDFRFGVYGRQFTSPAVLEFTGQNVTNLTDFVLGAEITMPDAGAITWEVEYNGSSATVYPVDLFDKRLAPAVLTSIKWRGHLSTTDVNASPAVNLNTATIYGFQAAAGNGAGKIIWTLATLTQNITKITMVYGAHLPGGALTFYASTDDGVTWTQFGAVSSGWPKPIDDYFSEYRHDPLTVPSGKNIRFKCVIDAPTPALAIPLLGQIGWVLQ